MSKKICRSSSESEEVAHFAIAEFMEHERGQELVDSGRAMNFLSGIIHRSFHSSTSKYHTIYRQKNRMHSLPDNYDQQEDTEMYDYEQDEATESIQGVLEDMKADGIDLWFRAVLFEMYVKEPNYSELARQTKIPRTTISKAVEEAKEYIQITLKNNNITYT
tara:strand:+ start:2124 stop:2609 length:486 start_codon:yes stop_codon:yes gene_type:complete